MESSCYSSLLGFLVCELSMSSKTHMAYKSIALDGSSSNENFLTAGAEIAKENYEKNINKTRAQTRTNIIQSKPWFNVGKFNQNRFFKGRNPGSKISSQLNNTVSDKYVKRLEKTHKELKAKQKNNNKAMEPAKSTRKHTNNVERILPDEEFDGGSHIVIKEEEVQDNWNHVENLEESACPKEFLRFKEMINFDDFLLLNEDGFKATFRVTHSSFKSLVLLLSNDDMEPIEDIPLYRKLLIVLWLLGHSKSYKDAALLFEVSEESIVNCFYDVCATLYDKCDNIINWPTSVQCSESAERIEKEFGFPGVVGVLGCHYFSMAIPKEPLTRREHFNGKLRTYCLALQIVCDDKFIIRDIFPGLPGGRAESQVFKESPLCEQLKSKTVVEPNNHILARSYYPQLPSMLTPYTKPINQLTDDEVDFNDLHENVCQLVDQTFHLLSQRFISLKRLDPEVATMVLVTVCVIHNICMANNDYI